MATGTALSAIAMRTRRPRIGEISEHDRQRQKRHQRPDAAAGFGDFERRVREEDDVAFAQHGNAGSRDGALAGLRCDKLQWKYDLVEKNRRDRNHQQQDAQRKRQHLEMTPSQNEKNRADQRAEHRDAAQEELGAKKADEQHAPRCPR